MAAGFTAPSHKEGIHAKTYLWFFRNQSKLFTLDIVCMVLLFFLHLFTSTFQVFSEQIISIVQVTAIVLVAFIALSVVWKGFVPIIFCIFGIVLMHNSIILPYYSVPETDEITFGSAKFVFMQFSPQAVSVATDMHFFLGATMVAFSIVVAYRPSLLFTMNRPESLESVWSKYPIWQDNAIIANGHIDPTVPLKSLMTDEDRYLLWRYEYVLVNIYGASHLVKPEGMIPKNSVIFRDDKGGRMIGKARYSGFFT
jgi:hypothetical protein